MVISGPITFKIILHQLKTRVTKLQVQSLITVLDTTQSKANINKAKTVNNERISASTVHLTTTEKLNEMERAEFTTVGKARKLHCDLFQTLKVNR